MTVLVQRVSGETLEGEKILRIAHLPHRIEEFRTAADVLEQIEFDGTTNAALLADLLENQREYTLLGGVLRKRGNSVQISADGDLFGYRRQIKQYLADVRSGATSSMTAAERMNRAEKALAVLITEVIEGSR